MLRGYFSLGMSSCVNDPRSDGFDTRWIHPRRNFQRTDEGSILTGFCSVRGNCASAHPECPYTKLTPPSFALVVLGVQVCTTWPRPMLKKSKESIQIESAPTETWIRLIYRTVLTLASGVNYLGFLTQFFSRFKGIKASHFDFLIVFMNSPTFSIKVLTFYFPRANSPELFSSLV